MDTLKDISDRSENYAQYLSAQDAMRVKLTEEELRQQAEEKLVQKDEQISEQVEQLSKQGEEIKRYREKLIAAGINPDEV